jgi:hypothetical protein
MREQLMSFNGFFPPIGSDIFQNLGKYLVRFLQIGLMLVVVIGIPVVVLIALR